GLAVAAHRDDVLLVVRADRVGRRVLPLRGVGVELLDALGEDATGLYAVHADAVLREIAREGLRHPLDRRTDRAGKDEIQVLRGLPHGRRGHVHDRTAARLPHVGKDKARETYSGEQRDAHRLLPRGVVEVIEAAGRRTTRVGDEDVDRPELVHGGLHELLATLRRADVGDRPLHLGAGLAL